ncbi:hypothetical protein FVEG_14982 [Fusarium verticillioides 7600]|uniref:Uncharacterized protein n=1 Tax=Gibberella moniliformis (strain M3125 / FGSC 7600) TaxID=334819 RepID=W7LUS7_GIBM7|nr:hypothetical protein FVEG_14982 [Fusarium verticillioides 7600]XP_018745389.1 hypothetical protein FVEG_14982 [Fusarium verticillioides 7600]XP_018745390.1 hypothetical protein FVEG_14982 [Fusarium verticillioides 7600]EWG39197.1 hypothetical protein FVEG_14982 [Fusarium verticillioides 7600]EWG39198.1 hypothetical protein FVEG_14982 [Fusarium verticillioides 7600]EWG39199.1 hypothetical protein FVEG_14982 [Fusarium verticillioides 7600]
MLFGCNASECKPSFCQRLAFYEGPISALSSPQCVFEASETSTIVSSVVQRTPHGIAAELMINGHQHAFLPGWVSVLCSSHVACDRLEAERRRNINTHQDRKHARRCRLHIRQARVQRII